MAVLVMLIMSGVGQLRLFYFVKCEMYESIFFSQLYFLGLWSFCSMVCLALNINRNSSVTWHERYCQVMFTRGFGDIISDVTSLLDTLAV